MFKRNLSVLHSSFGFVFCSQYLSFIIKMYSAKNFILLLALVYRVAAAEGDKKIEEPAVDNSASGYKKYLDMATNLPGNVYHAVTKGENAGYYQTGLGLAAAGTAGLIANRLGAFDRFKGKKPVEELPKEDEADEKSVAPKSSSSGPNKYLIFGGVVLLLAAIGAGLYFRSRSN